MFCICLFRKHSAKEAELENAITEAYREHKVEGDEQDVDQQKEKTKCDDFYIKVARNLARKVPFSWTRFTIEVGSCLLIKARLT